MANFKITLDTKNLEKQLKKQFQDAQRKAKQKAFKQQRLEFNADYEELPDGYADGITQILKNSHVSLNKALKMIFYQMPL